MYLDERISELYLTISDSISIKSYTQIIDVVTDQRFYHNKLVEYFKDGGASQNRHMRKDNDNIKRPLFCIEYSKIEDHSLILLMK